MKFNAILFTLLLLPALAFAQEKIILLENAPNPGGLFEVTPDGSKIYFAAADRKFAVFNAEGKPIDSIAAAGSGAPRELVPLPDGWFIAALGHAGGNIALYRPDGSEAKKLVQRGGNLQSLRSDMTGWTSPTGIAVDVEHKKIFALDTTVAPRNSPDPDFSRIAIFDFDGKYLSDIRRYDSTVAGKDDTLRTWYDDIEVDSKRQRVFVTARRTKELFVLDYDGKEIAHVPGVNGVAVFPDGRVAVGDPNPKTPGIRIYPADFDDELNDAKTIKLPASVNASDLETDASGRLYATGADATVYFARWTADLKNVETFGPTYERISVKFPEGPQVAGKTMQMSANAVGRPEIKDMSAWQVLLRPSDGSDLRWQSLPVTFASGMLQATLPAELCGFYELVVRYGGGEMDRANLKDEPQIRGPIVVLPRNATSSVAIITSTGRSAFRQGEEISLHVIRKDDADPKPAPLHIELKSGETVLATADASIEKNLAMEIPGTVTAHLVPGRYALKPTIAGHETYVTSIDIAPAEADSPMQRIIYHEFDQSPATQGNGFLEDAAERLSFIRDYTTAIRRLGFTRETDRLVGKLGSGAIPWNHGAAPGDTTKPEFAPAEYWRIPSGGNWETEYYLDQAVKQSIVYDSQLLGHCSSVRFHERWWPELVPMLQWGAQWFGRYPSFYGFNYNDEMFFTGYSAGEWTEADKQWLKKTEEEKFKGHHVDMLLYAHRVMYDEFNGAVRQSNPKAKITTTPMWQFPAVDGSYAPTIYDGMDEGYSHYLSEGYHLPWYAPQSADMIRRPGKPMMGVFDNGYGSGDGDIYLKNAMQMLGRGVQGVGTEHSRPFLEAKAASAQRVANYIAATYGPVFAQFPVANEAAILYSYQQDITEQRNVQGTPHWESVFSVYGAGLMCGVPMSIVYEEDLAAGWLTPKDGEKPRVPMLFLIGQKVALPQPIQQQIERFKSAGGIVITDADSAEYPGAVKGDFHTHIIKDTTQLGYAADTVFPLMFADYEKLATQIHEIAAKNRRFATETSDPWVSKNHFDGGAIQYVMLANETSPYPFDAGAVWSLGTLYNKSFLPKTVTLTAPIPANSVVYDVFEHAIVKPQDAKIKVDLTTFPGRLYAIAPAALGAPQISLGAKNGNLAYQVQAVDQSNKPLAARVPLRITLKSDDAHNPSTTIFRGTDEKGVFAASIPLPASKAGWAIEVTELLGGNASSAALPETTSIPSDKWLVARPSVEVYRDAQVRALLKDSGGKMTLLTSKPGVLTDAQKKSLAEAMKAAGVELVITEANPPEKPEAGIYLAAGHMQALGGRKSDLLQDAWSRGLMDEAATANVPGPGRGLVTALFAPRGYKEHCVALLGGDQKGLDTTVESFIEWLKKSPAPEEKAPPAPQLQVASKASSNAAPVARLSEMTGVKLTNLAVASDGKHLVVSADGYLRNLALVEDAGSEGKIVRAARVAHGPSITDLFVSPDGKFFGASGRVADRFGQGFALIDASNDSRQTFAGFGDIGRNVNHFAASADGKTVVTGGTYGIVAWRNEGGNAWKEAWSIDYWKEFPKLDWPVTNDSERVPQFHAYIPRGADYALIVFGELSANGWVMPHNHGAVSVTAVNLADGKEKWRFDVPLMKMYIVPTLLTSPDGSRLLLQVQMGSWGSESYRLYAFNAADGKLLGQWASKTAPQTAAISNSTGAIASVLEDRLLQVRMPDSKVVYNMLWQNQPLSVAFASDGKSIFVTDDAGTLTRLNDRGEKVWSMDVGANAAVAASASHVYTAAWDGMLRSFNAEDGKPAWSLDCTSALTDEDPIAIVKNLSHGALHQAARPSTTSAEIPAGDNLLKTGAATLTVGGTAGWMSNGKVDVKAEQLTNGAADDVATPWLNLDELFWDSTSGRQVFVEISFKQPTDVKSLTVRENAKFPNSWPTEGVVQVWDEPSKNWTTAAHSVYMNSAVNTYTLNLKGVSKMRYVPWSSYYRNFYTSEIEVR